MLELYHNINSVCAQKVRMALLEKGIEAKEHLLTLRGDQFDPAYMKLNPGAVVPTLVHDGVPIIESALILYYIDEAFPGPALMPKDPKLRHRVRLFNKLIDEYGHFACMTLTFATAFRPRLLQLTKEQQEAEYAKAPNKRRAEIKRDVIAHGLDSEFARDAIAVKDKLLHMIDDAVKAPGPYLAGDSYTLAECAVIPYVLRLELLRMSKLWDRYPGVARWWELVKHRPSTETTIWSRMGDADWAPFKSIKDDPWPKVQGMMQAA
jgi:glutathione S-transferase